MHRRSIHQPAQNIDQNYGIYLQKQILFKESRQTIIGEMDLNSPTNRLKLIIKQSQVRT